eukprot:COSAG02_NODE_2107_length_9809_cov_114.047786_3_plen_309_part_00
MLAACVSALAASAQAREKKPPPELHLAVAAGDLEDVVRILDEGADIEERDSNGENALMHAAWEGHAEIAQLLVDKGIDKNNQDRGGDYPLLFAAFRGHLPIVQLLCNSGGMEPDLQNMGGFTSLMMAVVSPLFWFDLALQRVTDAVAVVPSQQVSRHSPGGMKMVATLLSCGATTGVKTKEDRDVYSLSREDARKEVQELIKNEDRCSQLCTALCSEGDNTDPTCRGWDDGTSALTGKATKCELNDDESGCAVEGGDCTYIPATFAEVPEAACLAECTTKHEGSHGCGDKPAPRRRKRSAEPGDKADL